ncbi:unnamed protein product [Paramecium sonneborni]|uniref:Nbr1 FW domain-containing protein n=1 Tax=Paramecium sonneborni TaxID=65129 RepID=A0A8S1K5G1_9CILI|nr:unnamed protein product [Paramecium sonneborni]
MPFKIVFNRKIHKLPLHITTMQAIRSSIEKLYPQIDPSYHLVFFYNQEPLEIIHEDALVILLKILQLSTYKLFIFENNIGQLTEEDLKFMEQSSIYNASVIQIDQNLKQQQVRPDRQQQNQLEKVIQQKPNKEIEHQPIQQNMTQLQQQQSQQQCHQQNLQQQQNPQEQQNNYQSLLQGYYPSQKDQIQPQAPLGPQFQYPKIEIDINQEAYKIEVIQNQQVQSYPDKEFIWRLVLKNSGSKTWPQTMKIRCNDNPFKTKQFLLPEAIPGQVIEIPIKLKAPSKIDSFFTNWGFYYLENTLECALQFTICLFLDIIMEQLEQRFIGTQILVKAEQVKAIMTDQSINYLCKFIEKHKILKWRVDEIINKIYDEQSQK